MNLQESIRRILREEIEIPGYLKRRLYIVDDYFNKLVPEIICENYSSVQSDQYVNQVMGNVVDEILKDMRGRGPSQEWLKFGYIDLYDKVYEDLVRMGYRDKVHDFFYDTLLECE